MNNALKAAFAAVKENPNDAEKRKALKELAVPKFKEIYGRIQEAVKTVNRHVAPGKGTPNRAKLATAIGLMTEVDAFNAIGLMIEMPEMNDAVEELRLKINMLENMRKERKYDHIDYLPNFMTVPEKAEADLQDCRIYLMNITDAVNAAIETIGRHVVLGDFDVNTFKIAKAIGYKDETGRLRADFKAFAERTGEDFAAELKQLDAVDAAIAAIVNGRRDGFKTVVTAVSDFDPYAFGGDDDEVDEDGDDLLG